jgi:hypothetical protein
VVGAICRPTSFSQFWVWAGQFMPKNEKLHMVGLAAMCWALWQSRNKICFDKKKIRSPVEIICLASSVIKYWAGLQGEEDKVILMEGAEALKDAALLHHSQDQDQGEPQAGTVLLQ